MTTIRVYVEKKMVCSGYIDIEPEFVNGEEIDPIDTVHNMIEIGQLQTTEIDWDEPEYLDFSFNVTGDADEL